MTTVIVADTIEASSSKIITYRLPKKQIDEHPNDKIQSDLSPNTTKTSQEYENAARYYVNPLRALAVVEQDCRIALMVLILLFS